MPERCPKKLILGARRENNATNTNGYTCTGSEKKPNTDTWDTSEKFRLITRSENNTPDMPTVHSLLNAVWNTESIMVAAAVCIMALIGMSSSMMTYMAGSDPIICSNSRASDIQAIMLKSIWKKLRWRNGEVKIRISCNLDTRAAGSRQPAEMLG